MIGIISKYREFRNKLDNDAYQLQTLKNDKYDFDMTEEYTPLSTVYGILDTIEDIVNDVCERLEDITGLAEIDDVKKIVNELSNQLY